MKVYFLILILLLSATVSAAHKRDSVEVESEVVNLYIDNYKHLLTTRFFGATKFMNIGLEADKTDSTQGGSIQYQPNTGVSMGFGFNYKWLGLNVAFHLPNSANEKEIQGETKQLDLQVNIFGRASGADFFYQHYKGFYNSNPTLVNKAWRPGDAFPIRSDIIARSAGAHYMHFFNADKFSYSAPFLQTSRQKKSAGSFVLGATGSYFHIMADSSIVPRNLINEFGEGMAILDGVFNSVGLEFGYIHTLVFNNLFVTGSLIPGLLFEHQSVKRAGSEKKENEFTGGGRFVLRLALGRNAQRWFYGVGALADIFIIRQIEPSQMTYVVGSVKFFLVHRFTFMKEKEIDITNLLDQGL